MARIGLFKFGGSKKVAAATSTTMKPDGKLFFASSMEKKLVEEHQIQYAEARDLIRKAREELGVARKNNPRVLELAHRMQAYNVCHLGGRATPLEILEHMKSSNDTPTKEEMGIVHWADDNDVFSADGDETIALLRGAQEHRQRIQQQQEECEEAIRHAHVIYQRQRRGEAASVAPATSALKLCGCY